VEGSSLSRYRTIVADPPWHYQSSDILTRGQQRTASVGSAKRASQYGTMTLDDICALPVESMADDDAHLYLWVTCPLLFRAERVVNAWGFEYKTVLTWEKQGALGLGFHFRVQTEHVIFATRGDLPIPPAARVKNVFAAPRGRHSAKPDMFLDLVEEVARASDAEPMLELFARRARFGWDYWGHESLGTAEMPAA
jgi:N6-adenosine-specific RNA methylase IME4